MHPIYSRRYDVVEDWMAVQGFGHLVITAAGRVFYRKVRCIERVKSQDCEAGCVTWDAPTWYICPNHIGVQAPDA